eukprot:Blabericola_migrator_1__895@NODE_121_length_13441_cov_57_998280_g108_i0_p2_GENE_NODE_121_length_13441_cov_57_998280_g108_i0NODE_121_length_13441_cov_57_998280_g108_i0_p2_ORF_typecomplete_len1177_score150_32E1E2_ATPase/PF00122_20/1_8e03E1E2_ATPase/PF00122_20/4_3e40Hydrolase/PF00702_26/4e24HAD/PF12710_7/1_4e04HAD/PF12710_7/0_11DUF3674/PF12426_8/0_18Hydrolase_3/PF08282_12/4_9e03Hydrolase_3/PF08282_12/1_NODE_121_length_13441_cov_57_998280_g108_i0938812918
MRATSEPIALSGDEASKASNCANDNPSTLRVSVKAPPFEKLQGLSSILDSMRGRKGINGLQICSSTPTEALIDISYFPARISVRAIYNLIGHLLRSEGSPLTLTVVNEPPPIDSVYNDELRTMRRSLIMCSIPATLIVWLSMTPSDRNWKFLELQPLPGVSLCSLILMALATPIQWHWGKPIHHRAWQSLKQGHITMDSFISFNTTFCYVASVFLLILAVCTTSYTSQEIQAFHMTTTTLPLPKFDQLYHEALGAKSVVNETLLPNVVDAAPQVIVPASLNPSQANQEVQASTGNLIAAPGPPGELQSSAGLHGFNLGELPIEALPRHLFVHSHHQEHGVPHFFETSALLITVVLLGKTLELSAKKRTLTALVNLNKTKEKQASLVRRVLVNPDAETRLLTDAENAVRLQDPPYSVRWLTDQTASTLKTFRSAHRQLAKIAVPSQFDESEEYEEIQFEIHPHVDALTETLKDQSPQSPEGFCMVEVVQCAAALVQPGDLVRVESGQKIPADGIIVSHDEIAVDESLISGESLPVTKKNGDRALEGSIVYSPVVYVIVTHVGKDSVLGQVIDTVRQASGCKTPMGAIADKISTWFLPGTLFLTLITWAVWTYLVLTDRVNPFEGRLIPNHEVMRAAMEFMFIMKFGISTLAIACPCALGLATPTATTVAAGKAVEFGVLIKNGSALETGAKAENIVLDKTGTLTQAKPSVLGAYLRVDAFFRLACNTLPMVRMQEGTALQEQPISIELRVDVNEPLMGSQVSVMGGVPRTPYVVSRSTTVPSDTQSLNTMWAVFWAIVDLMEQGVVHPVAEAIRLHTRSPSFPYAVTRDSMDLLEMRNKGQVDGKGLVAEFVMKSNSAIREEGETVTLILGSVTYCQNIAKANTSHVFEDVELKAWLHDGSPATVVCLMTDKGTLLGVIKLHDDLTPVSARAVAMMVDQYKRRVYMCTGDNEHVARYIAQKVGIPEDRVVSGASPWRKREIISQLAMSSKPNQMPSVDADPTRNGGRGVIMVGDGSNDSLAMVESDVGVAVGAGSNITAMAADVLLIKSDLEAFLSFIKLSNKTWHVIQRNFLWAFIFNVIGLPVAAGVLYPRLELPPLYSGVAMASSSLLVVLNSLTLFFVRPVLLQPVPLGLSWREKIKGWIKFTRQDRYRPRPEERNNLFPSGLGLNHLSGTRF